MAEGLLRIIFIYMQYINVFYLVTNLYGVVLSIAKGIIVYMLDSKKVKEALDWILHIGIAILIGVLIVTFVAQRTLVHDVSMEPTLVEGDNLIVEKLSARLGGLKRGDIIVFDSPNGDKQLIKRLIAFEGEKIEIKDYKVYINGELLEEEYLNGEPTTGMGNPEYESLVVPEGQVFAMGDNRGRSGDSRSFGPVNKSSINGKAIFRFYPFNKIGAMK